MLGLARGALKLKREDLQAALDGDLSARHLFVPSTPTPSRCSASWPTLTPTCWLPCSPTLGARPVADHSRHRPDCCRADPHRDRRRHGALRLRRAPGPGLRCARATTSRRASRVARVTATASSGTSCAVRQCRALDQEHPGGQVPQPDGAQVAQEGHRGGGAQDDPLDLRAAHAQARLPRSTHRLRGDECKKERTALDQATQAHRQVARARHAPATASA